MLEINVYNDFLVTQVGHCWMILDKFCFRLKMLDAVGCCWMMLEWFGQSTPQSHVGASAMAKARHILNSFTWVEGSFGCDLRKVEPARAQTSKENY